MSTTYSSEWPEISCSRVSDSSSLLQCGDESYVVEHAMSDQEEFLELGLRWGAAISKKRADEKVLADLRALNDGIPQELLTESSWAEIASLRETNGRLLRSNAALVEILRELVMATVSGNGLRDALTRARIILRALTKTS